MSFSFNAATISSGSGTMLASRSVPPSPYRLQPVSLLKTGKDKSMDLENFVHEFRMSYTAIGRHIMNK